MRLAILAKGPTLQRYPGRDGYKEVWGLNQLGLTRDLDRLFVMDDLVLRMPAWDADLPEALKHYPRPIVTSKVYEDWPTAQRFPIEEVAKHFGLPLGISMYSTVDYMIALGVYEGYDVIELFGVDCTQAKREERERASIARWIAVAQNAGVRVIAQPQSFFYWYTNTGVCYEHGMYGYAGPPRIESLCDTKTNTSTAHTM
jgi:hypothetical protein